ncbi:MAG: hypothetical protein Pg6A_00980 [Termitinemataceae bacterium]|jgi:hypothetical protein|nr:MAG: hypothetical protein Pg6A_00980 [Termitinemataceae bacterium]
MTINDLVQKAIEHFNEKSITYQKLEKYLAECNINVKPDFGAQIFDHYNRKLINLHKSHGEESSPEKFNQYAQAQKELNSFIDQISKNIPLEEIITLKQKVDNLVDSAILWNKR